LDTFLNTIALTAAALMTDQLTTDQADGRFIRQRVADGARTSTIEIKDDFVVTRQSHQTRRVPRRTGSQQHL